MTRGSSAVVEEDVELHDLSRRVRVEKSKTTETETTNLRTVLGLSGIRSLMGLQLSDVRTEWTKKVTEGILGLN